MGYDLIIEEVHKFCLNRYLNGEISNPAYKSEGESLWHFHILPVVEHSKYLCEIYNIDCLPVLLGAYFHDITRLDGDDKYHHLSSADFASKFLNKFNLESSVIKIVYEAIYQHRGSLDTQRNSIESKILASADGFALISNIHLLFYSAYKKNNLGLIEGVNKVNRKINNSKKKLLPESSKLLEDNYGSFIKQLEKIS